MCVCVCVCIIYDASPIEDQIVDRGIFREL